LSQRFENRLDGTGEYQSSIVSDSKTHSSTPATGRRCTICKDDKLPAVLLVAALTTVRSNKIRLGKDAIRGSTHPCSIR
jgi:hypothetical protein